VIADDSDKAKSPCSSVGTRCVSEMSEKVAARCSSAARSTGDISNANFFSWSATNTDMA
jgi:hypothetical protein